MSVMMLYLLIVTIMLGGLALDTVTAWSHQQRLQATADAAALAAARQLPDQARAVQAAMEMAELNLPSPRYGVTIRPNDIIIGRFDPATGEFLTFAQDPLSPPNSVRVITRRDSVLGNPVSTFVMRSLGRPTWDINTAAIATRLPSTNSCVVGELLGGLQDYMMVFTDGRTDAHWGGTSPGYAGDIAINGDLAVERTSGSFPYSGRILTNDSWLNGWDPIVAANPGTSYGLYLDQMGIDALIYDFDSAVASIRAMDVSQGFEDVDLLDLDELDTRDGRDKTYVINVTSWTPNAVIDIRGDAGDTYVLRWDSNPRTLALDGRVSFGSGGGIVPHGDLLPTNFVHLAGDISASSGGTTPTELEPWLLDLPNRVDGGGFFTGYWLTLGSQGTRETQPLSNFRILGGWFTNTTKFSLGTGSSGVYVPPPERGILAPCRTGSDVIVFERSQLVQ